MITAISNSNGYNPKVNSANYNSSNETRKGNNSSQVIDSFANSKQVSFEGNLAKAGESLLGNAGSKIGGKVRRLGEEAFEAVGGTFRKLVGKNELPSIKKPIIAATTNEYADKCSIRDMKWNLENANLTDAQKKTYEDILKNAKYDDYGIDLASRQKLDELNFKVEHHQSFGSADPSGSYDGGNLDCGSGDSDLEDSITRFV